MFCGLLFQLLWRSDVSGDREVLVKNLTDYVGRCNTGPPYPHLRTLVYCHGPLCQLGRLRWTGAGSKDASCPWCLDRSHVSPSLLSTLTLCADYVHSLGSVVEIVLFLVLLQKDYFYVIKAAILGSILATMLLCLGLCFFIGGFRHSEQTFSNAVTETGHGLLFTA